MPKRCFGQWDCQIQIQIKIQNHMCCFEQCVILRLTARVIFSGYTSCPIVSTVSTKMLMCSFQTYTNIDEFTMYITFIHASITYTIHIHIPNLKVPNSAILFLQQLLPFMVHGIPNASLSPFPVPILWTVGTRYFSVWYYASVPSLLHTESLVLNTLPKTMAIFYPLCVHATKSGFQYPE